MKILSAIIFALWFLSICAEIGLVVVLLRQGLAKTYAGLTLWAMVSAVSGIHCYYAHLVWHSYLTTWRMWEPIALAALILLTADVAYQIGRQWPARGLAVGVNVFFGILSVLALAKVAQLLPATAWGADALLIRLREHFALACACTIAANWMIYSIPMPEWRQNTRRHVRVAFILTAGMGLAFLLVAWRKQYATVAVSNVFITGLPLACCVMWARMGRGGEHLAVREPQEGLLESLEDLDRKRRNR